MKVEEWLKRYIVDCTEDYQYFGEVDFDGDQYTFGGTGLYYYPIDNCFRFMEHHNQVGFNGMYFEESVSDNDVNYFQAGFATNGRYVGPHLFFKKTNKAAYKNEKFEIIYSELNENSLSDGPSIAIYPNNTFDVVKYVNGQILDFRIRFGHGKLFLEKSGMANPIDVLDCGWDFEPVYVDVSPEYCSSFNGKGIKPSIVEMEKIDGKYSNVYYGAVLTCGKEQEYYLKDKRHIFVNEVFKYGIVEFPDGSKYFGEIKVNGQEGDYYRHGFGCYRDRKECYLGYYKFSERSYWGLIKKSNCTYFGQFENGKLEGLVFEKIEDKLIIAIYKQGKRVGNYYEIDNETFDVVEKDDNGSIKKRASFSTPKNKEKELSNEDKISPNIINVLNHYNLSYVIEDNLDIYVTGSTLPKELVTYLFIPNCVKGIKSEAFSGCKNLKRVTILNGISYIGEGAFKDCDKIEEVELPNSIDTIGPYTFTSKCLEEIKIPLHVSLIKNYAFSECKNLKFAKLGNPACVVEKYAFPKHIDYLNGKNTLEDKIEDENQVSQGVDKTNKTAEKIEAIKEKTGDVFKRIGEFFTKDIVNFFVFIGKFFVAIFEIVKDFFKYTFPKFFSKKSKREARYNSKSYYSGHSSCSFFEAVGGFFAIIGKGILTVLCAPFKFLKMILSGGGTIVLAGGIIMAIYVVLTLTKAIDIFNWNVSWYVPHNQFFGYNWPLVHWALALLQMNEFFSFIFGIILIIVGAIIDFLIYFIMAIVVYAIPHIIQILIQVIIVYAIPVAIPVGSLILLIKGESKGAALISFVLNLTLTIIYFVLLSS